MANLLLGVPTVPLAASSVSLSAGTASSIYPLSNLWGGNRTDYFQLSSAVTGPTGNIQIEMATPSPTSANFLFVAGARRTILQGVSGLNLRYNSTNSYATGTDVFLPTAWSLMNLRGTANSDYFSSFPTITSQFWWLNTFGNSSRPIEKLFLGSSFDMGRDPEENGGIVTMRSRSAGSQRKPLYTFDITWTGVQYSRAVDFYRTFVISRRHQPLIIYTANYHEILNNHRVVFCRLISASTPPRSTNICDVSATFEEVL